MKIIKYKKVGKNKYLVELDNFEEIILYEDVILKENLLIKKEINDLNNIININNEYALYDKTLSYISKKQRCEKEIRDYLKKYTNDFNQIELIINRLKDKNLIEEELYLKSFIHDKIYLSMDGPLKIKKDLELLGFDSNIIDDNLIEFTSDIIKDKIERYINKQLKINKKSLYIFKQKILLNLTNLGYSKEDILECLDNIHIDEDNLKEKEKEKLIKKYSKKYSGLELDKIIKQKLYEKGYW